MDRGSTDLGVCAAAPERDKVGADGVKGWTLFHQAES